MTWCAIQAAAFKLSQERRKQSKIYIRYGELPLTGKSRIYNRAGEIIGEEKGISVFEYIERRGIVVPDNKDAQDDFFTLSKSYWKPAYLVSGEEVGIGRDGEPLLKNVKIIKTIRIAKDMSHSQADTLNVTCLPSEVYDNLTSDKSLLTNEELKLCPFCGGRAMLKIHKGSCDSNEWSSVVKCNNCHAEVWGDEDKAITKWNKRINSDIDVYNAIERGYKKMYEKLEESLNTLKESGILAHKENLETTPKLTYTDVEKMVKPLKWDENTATLQLRDSTKVVFNARKSRDGGIFEAQMKIENGIPTTIAYGLREEYVKPVVQEFLVNLVAASLDVERSRQ